LLELAIPEEVSEMFMSCRGGRRMMFIGNIHERAPIILSKVMERRGDPERTGAYLTVWQTEIPESVVQAVKVCEVTNGRDEKYGALSIEKTERTYQMHNAHNHISSYQSQDPENEQYQGGVLLYDSSGRRFIFAISGLDAEDDEAASLLLGLALGMTRESCDAVAAVSKNQAYYDLVEWVSQIQEG